MHICLDIDDTITYAPGLFAALLTALPDAEVSVVTFRKRTSDALETLRECGIRCDRLIVSTDPERGQVDGQNLAEWKASVVNELAPDWFFEDMPEVVSRIRSEVTVFMPCDEVIRQWLADAANVQ